MVFLRKECRLASVALGFPIALRFSVALRSPVVLEFRTIRT
jgi:hypothetical protein